ncbi:MAG TPA: hypothetical protein VG839_03900 [Asticcacaulis sp.]|nr:hypothetical protein [Asticcacaulis sp.]
MTLNRPFRTFLGLATGALVTSVVGFPLTIGNLADDPGNAPPYWLMLLAAALYTFIISLPVGLAGHVVLYALKRRQLPYYAGLATVGGGAFALAICLRHKGIDPLFSARNVPIYAVWAGACAAIAWFIRRPDKDVPKMPDLASHF